MAIGEAGGYNHEMPLDATIERLPEGTAVVTLAGPMTLGGSLKVADSQIHSAITDGVTKMIFDMTGVDYVDSAGLGMMVYTCGTINKKGGAFRAFGVAPRVLTMLQMTKVDTFLGICGSLEESLAGLGG